jgi:uncharacterized protein YegL
LKTEDGYFTYYFPSQSLKSLPKIVLFVLDISGSMIGSPMIQTKDAMVTMLDSLDENVSKILKIFKLL